MAEEASIVKDLVTYSLVFDKLSLEFDIFVALSIENTAVFLQGKPADFAFVVAEIWLRSNGSRHLVCSQFDTGNLSEFLRKLSNTLLNPQRLPEWAESVGRRGLASWFDEYRKKLEQELVLAEDEKHYDELTQLLVTADNRQYIAVYKCGNVPTIEVRAQAGTSSGFVDVIESFDAEFAANEAIQLKEVQVKLVRGRMNLQ